MLTIAILLPTPARAQFVQQGSKLVGAGAAGAAEQGEAVACSADGSTVAVGAPGDNNSSGAVWIYTRSGGVWNQQGNKLVGSGAVGAARQGNSVALSADGNTLLAGGPGDNDFNGAAWVFNRSGGVWTQQGAKLVGVGIIGPAPAGQGISVSLSADGNTALIGASADNGFTGAAWVFTRSGGLWAQQSKLVGDSETGAAQGASVSLSADGNTAILGGPTDGNDGAAWVFARLGGVWKQQGAKLVGSGVARGDDKVGQGTSVALSSDGNTAIVGAPWDNEVSDYYGVGATWVYTRSTSGVWTQQGSKLVGAGSTFVAGKDGAAQGWSVALSSDGNTAIIGGPCDGNTGDCYDRGASGAAWVFTRSGGVWTQTGDKLVGAGTAGNAKQAVSVALSGDGTTAVVGGSEDHGKLGAAWVFVRTSGLPNSAPQISPGGVVNGASFQPGISPGTWITITGSNLSATTRAWRAGDFSGGNLPVQLDDVSVTVNGKPAYVYFVSPTQLNVLAPSDSPTGPVPVQVSLGAARSNVETAVASTVLPGLFTLSAGGGGTYAAAVRADGVYVAPPGLVPGLTTVPAKPGDVVLLFGTGFGPTTPPVPIGQTINSAPLASPIALRIGGVTATVQYAGVVSPGLCQFNVVVPNVPSGDNPVSVEIAGKPSQPGVLLPVKQ